MGLVVVILFAGLFVRVNERSLGWISREKVNQVRSMMENHGFGFNWGMSYQDHFPRRKVNGKSEDPISVRCSKTHSLKRDAPKEPIRSKVLPTKT